jgi:anti-repressor protein
VSKILGLRGGFAITRQLDPDEKGTHTVRTPAGPQKVRIVNEAGLYTMILRSRRPEAVEFKRWITHEVLPTIRKTGGYIKNAGGMSDKEILIRALDIKEKMIADRNLSISPATSRTGPADMGQVEVTDLEKHPQGCFSDSRTSP